MDKPFLTFDQQIMKLKDEYNLIIQDEDFAKETLSSLSYYDLINGYQFIYIDENNKYLPGPQSKNYILPMYLTKIYKVFF